MLIIFQCNNNTMFPFVLKYGSIPPNSMFFPSRLSLKSSPSGTESILRRQLDRRTKTQA